MRHNLEITPSVRLRTTEQSDERSLETTLNFQLLRHTLYISIK